MKIKSLIRSKVLIEISEAVTQTASGIFLPGEAVKQPREGNVIMIGPKVEHVKIGDTVRHYEHCGVPIEYQGKKCLFLQEKTEIELIL